MSRKGAPRNHSADEAVREDKQPEQKQETQPADKPVKPIRFRQRDWDRMSTEEQRELIEKFKREGRPLI